MSEKKRCPSCSETYPATLEHFYKNTTNKNGLDSYCKRCRSLYQQRYYESNKKQRQSKQRNYYHLNRTAELERGRKFREENPEYMRNWRNMTRLMPANPVRYV